MIHYEKPTTVFARFGEKLLATNDVVAGSYFDVTAGTPIVFSGTIRGFQFEKGVATAMHLSSDQTVPLLPQYKVKFRN